MTQTFLDKVTAITNEAFESIKKQVPENGAIHLAEPDEDLEDIDTLNLPTFLHFDKHGMTEYSSLIEVFDNNGVIYVKGYGKETGAECWMELERCSCDEICFLADTLQTETV